ncbi:MAG: His/Gly/Thr/Pro-type tRNA ligase C-terminal domain-containing protein [Candidatus Hodarchaeales archaeon]|jgi:hypothetical protein
MSSSKSSETVKAKILEKFRENLHKAKILDFTYPVQGSYILLPYGSKLKSMIFQKFTNTFETQLNSQYVELPIQIPQSFLKFHSNNEKIEESPNYSEQHFLVTPDEGKISSQPIFRGALDLGLYHICKQTIRSNRHLPQSWFASGPVIRKDSGVILARDPEIDFLEGIIAFDPEITPYEEYMKKIMILMIETFNSLGIPVRALWKPSSAERFDEYKTIKLFTNIHGDDSLVSVGIIHYFHDYPMKNMNIKVQNKKQINFFPSVINFGITQRTLFAYLIHHMDDMGFNIPPNSSLYDLSLALRAKPQEIAKVYEKIELTMNNLEQKYSIHDYTNLLDIKERLITSEAQGIPIRLETGLKDLVDNNFKLFVRKTKEKFTIHKNELINEIEKNFKKILNLYENEFATKKDYLNNWQKNGLVTQINVCGNCETSLNDETKLLGRIIEDINPMGNKKCQYCEKNNAVTYFKGKTW